MSWQDEMHAAIADYLGIDGKIISMSDSTVAYGGCETCGPEYETELDIVWEDADGTRQYRSWSGGLADMIRNIT